MLEKEDILAVEYAEEARFLGYRRRIRDKEARGDEHFPLRVRRHGRFGGIPGRSPREGEKLRSKVVGRVVREDGGDFGQKRGRCIAEGDSFSIGGESIVAGGGGALRVVDSGDARPTFSFRSRIGSGKRVGKRGRESRGLVLNFRLNSLNFSLFEDSLSGTTLTFIIVKML